METKLVKCPACGHGTEVAQKVRRKFCRLCGRLMEEVIT